MVRVGERSERRGGDARSIPRLGGVAMFVGVAVACGAGAVVRFDVWSRVIPAEEVLALGIGMLLVFLVGVADDLVGASPWQKLLVQFVAAWMIVAAGWSFHVLRLPLVGEVDLGSWGGPLSILWVVGVTNAINLIDGLDGLAAGVAAIVGASLLAYSLFQDNQATAILLAAVVGACLGFLAHNWEPAKIFMGDGGALTLGFLFGALTLHSSLKAPAAVAILVPILALGLPVLDTLLVMTVRFVEGDGRPLVSRFLRMFRADRSHLHHLLGAIVARRGRIVMVLYATVALFCGGALAVALSGEGGLGLALLAVELLVVFAMRRMGLAAEARALAAGQRAEARRTFARWWRGESAAAPAGDLSAAAEEPPTAVGRES
jgi:UDP-GlcNAc:undecaprenyl-phosphate GlcNAc-1-phosphate transferase